MPNDRDLLANHFKSIYNTYFEASSDVPLDPGLTSPASNGDFLRSVVVDEEAVLQCIRNNKRNTLYVAFLFMLYFLCNQNVLMMTLRYFGVVKERQKRHKS